MGVQGGGGTSVHAPRVARGPAGGGQVARARELVREQAHARGYRRARRRQHRVPRAGVHERKYAGFFRTC